MLVVVVTVPSAAVVVMVVVYVQSEECLHSLVVSTTGAGVETGVSVDVVCKVIAAAVVLESVWTNVAMAPEIPSVK